MAIRALTQDDRTLLREATLANMNWNGTGFTFADVDGSDEFAHYFRNFPSGGDFGFVDEQDDQVRAVAWLIFLTAEDPGYGFVDIETPELSIMTFTNFRGRGIGSALLAELISTARARGLTGISLSVEDGNGARRLYDRSGFRVVGRNGGSDTMFLNLTAR